MSRASNKPGWYKSEITLCRDYKGFIRLRSEHDFHEKVAYLTKAGDLGRRPMPALIWVLTTLMVFVKAMGFSYVLAGWTIPGASENLQQTGALGIAFLVSVVLVAFTHFAGHEQYKSSKTKQARREWNEAVPKNQYIKQELGLAHSQSADDAQPHYFQIWNRVGETQGANIVTIATIIFVAAVAIGATYVRGQVLENSCTNRSPAATTKIKWNLRSTRARTVSGSPARAAVPQSLCCRLSTQMPIVPHVTRHWPRQVSIGMADVCLLLQITLIGWIPAALWAVFSLNQYKTDKKIEEALRSR